MYALLYRSTASCAFAASDFESLRESSSARNELWGITSLLLCGLTAGGKEGFVQWVEGDREIVQALYTHIQSDARHAEFEVLAEGDVLDRVTGGKRLFSARTMEVRHTDGTLPCSAEGFLEAFPTAKTNG